MHPCGIVVADAGAGRTCLLPRRARRVETDGLQRVRMVLGPVVASDEERTTVGQGDELARVGRGPGSCRAGRPRDRGGGSGRARAGSPPARMSRRPGRRSPRSSVPPARRLQDVLACPDDQDPPVGERDRRGASPGVVQAACRCPFAGVRIEQLGSRERIAVRGNVDVVRASPRWRVSQGGVPRGAASPLGEARPIPSPVRK